MKGDFFLYGFGCVWWREEGWRRCGGLCTVGSEEFVMSEKMGRIQSLNRKMMILVFKKKKSFQLTL